MNLFELFKQYEDIEGFTLTGGKALENNPDLSQEVLDYFNGEVTEKTAMGFVTLYLIKSFDSDGEYAEGSLVAIDKNNNIISEQEIWRA